MYVFIDCRLPEQAVSKLCAYGHHPVLCPAHELLDPAIASHPDMLLFPIEKGIFVHDAFPFDAGKIACFPIAQVPLRTYPHDVLLNAARIGDCLVCRPDATAAELLAYAKQRGLTLLPVRQGYAKCNLCVVSDCAAITEDVSIANALRGAGIDVLQIKAGGVSLPGYPYGFIGGACGTDGTHVFFNGELSLHPDGVRMAKFCQKHGKIPVSLAEYPLCDVGSFLFFG